MSSTPTGRPITYASSVATRGHDDRVTHALDQQFAIIGDELRDHLSHFTSPLPWSVASVRSSRRQPESCVWRWFSTFASVISVFRMSLCGLANNASVSPISTMRAAVDHGHTVADVACHGQRMRDDDQRHIELAVDVGAAGQGSAQLWCESSALVASSHSMTLDGLLANARAMATRCCWPPDSWLG